MFDQRKHDYSGAYLLLSLSIVIPATAYPATTPVPDAPPISAGVVALHRVCASFRELSFPDGTRAAPLTRGPCAEGEWAVLDPVAPEGPRLRCALRPCPQRQIPFKGHCLSAAVARAALCPTGGGEVHLSPAGQPLCVAVPSWARGRSIHAACEQPRPPATTAVAVAALNCAQRDDGDCGKAVLGHPTSATVIEPED